VEAENRLKDYLTNGLVVEIYLADQAYALAEEIGKHAEQINAAGFADLFFSLQIMLSDRQTLAATKLLDAERNKYLIRSIPGTLNLLERHATLWRIPERRRLYQALTQGAGSGTTTHLERLGNDELTYKVVEHFRGKLPESEPLQEIRDKRIAHNEAIEPSDLQPVTWGQAIASINFAKNFLTTIGYGYLNIAFDPGCSDYYFLDQAKRPSVDLRRLLNAADISQDV
jgi:hypothetical protein